MSAAALIAFILGITALPVVSAHDEDDCSSSLILCEWQYHVSLDLNAGGCVIALAQAGGGFTFVGVITGASNDHPATGEYSCWATGVYFPA